MKKTVVLTLCIAAAALTPITAQDKPQPAAAAQPAPPAATRHVPLRVQLTLSRFLGDKKLSSAPYMFGVLPNGQKTSLRMGVQVPVTQTVFGAGKPDGVANIPQSSYTYKDVGTNIDCQAQDAGNGLYTLVITVSDSSINLDRSTEANDKRLMRDIPSFRSFHASFAMALRDGQTMQYASATDPVSGEVMKIDVMLAMAK